MAKPNQVPKLQFPEMDPVFQQHYSQLIDTINTLAGYNGTVELNNHLDLGGKRIMNVAPPTAATDAITSGVAAGKYSPAALKPSFEAGGSQPFASYRQIGSQSQREPISSWLTDLMSTPPSANTIFPTLTNSGGSVQSSIPASVFTFADNSTVRTQARTDLLAKPAQYAITSLSVASGIVTCDCAASGLVAGEIATIVPGTNQSFAGVFQLISSTGGGAVLEYQDPSAGGTDSSGFVQVNGCYYYSIKKRQNYLNLKGPFAADTSRNRLQVCMDGSTIVAVVVITNSGGQVSQSGGGGSPIVGSPTAGSFF